MTTGKASSSRRDLGSKVTISLSAIGLLADVMALAQVAYSAIILKNTSNIVIQLVAIVLAFLLGLGLGVIGIRGLERTPIEKVVKVYTWSYLLLAGFSYLGIVAAFRQPYTFADYIAYVVIVVLQLGAFSVLRYVSRDKDITPHALGLITFSVIHSLIFLYTFIFVGVPELIYVIGELAFWLGWTLFAAFMLYRSIGSRSRFRRR